jgi:predicted transcriptional regulator
VDGGALTAGVPVVAVIAVADQEILYHFSGVAGQHVTFDVSASSWTNGTTGSTAHLYVSSPTGAYAGRVDLGQGPTYGEFTLNATGTWQVLLDPTLAATGNATFAMARDVADRALVSGTPLGTSIGFRGQNALYHFSGVSGEHVTFDVSASSWSNGTTGSTAHLYVSSPTGVYVGRVDLGQGATYGEFTLNATGTWRVVLDPTLAATGHATFAMARDVADRALVPGSPLGTSVGFRGQNALYHFSGVAGQQVTIDVPASSWTIGATPGTAHLYVYDPTGAYVGRVDLGQTATSGAFALNATGTWRARLDPTGAAIGHATFTLTAAAKG